MTHLWILSVRQLLILHLWCDSFWHKMVHIKPTSTPTWRLYCTFNVIQALKIILRCFCHWLSHTQYFIHIYIYTYNALHDGDTTLFVNVTYCKWGMIYWIVYHKWYNIFCENHKNQHSRVWDSIITSHQEGSWFESWLLSFFLFNITLTFFHSQKNMHVRLYSK